MFSDTVNTGIYVMEPEVFDYDPGGASPSTGPTTCSRRCWTRTSPLYGYVADGYWEDVGTHENYLQAQADVLTGRVDVDIDAFEVSPGRLGGRGRRGRPGGHPARARSTSATTPRSRPAPSCASTPCWAATWWSRSGAFLHRAVVHDNVYIGPQRQPARLRDRQEHRRDARRARVEEGAVVGDECLIEEEAHLRRGQGLPVQDHRGRRGGQQQRDLGVRAASAACSARAGSPASSTWRSPRSCACGWPAPTPPP